MTILTDNQSHLLHVPVTEDEMHNLHNQAMAALWCLPIPGRQFQIRCFDREFGRAFGYDEQANVCRGWIARLGRPKGVNGD